MAVNKKGIIQDPLSTGILAVALMLILYFVFVARVIELMLYPIVLLVAALVFRVFINKKLVTDEEIDQRESKSMLYHYLIALAGIGVGSFIVRGLYNFPVDRFLPASVVPLGLAFMDAAMFTTLMAIVEEQFFRGELLEFFKGHMTPGLAILANALAFAAYHLGVYGTQPANIMYVLVGGIALASVTIANGRLLPAVMAHITNNLLSVL